MATDKKISELADADALTGPEFVEVVQGGVNKKTTTQAIADLGGGGGGAVDSVNGQTGVVVLDAADVGADPSGSASAVNTALNNHISDATAAHAASAISFAPAGSIAATDVQGAIAELDSETTTNLAAKVDEEDFATLTFASPTVWANNTRQMPLAKVTASGNFTIDMTSVKSGAQGVLKITSSTASTITLTFDTSFTNLDAITGATLLTYTFPALNGAIYINTFVCDGTTIHWVIGDYFSPAITNPWARLQRAAVQSIGNNDLTVALSIDTENTDNAAIWDSGNPTRMVIVGSGNKIATVSVLLDFASNGASVGVRRGFAYVNGAAAPGAFASKNVESTSVSTTVVATWQVECVAGDYIEIIPYQNSGGNLNVTGRVAIKIESR